MASFCKDCGSSNLIENPQVFKDNTTHIRLDCGECNSFNGYKKQHDGFNRTLLKDYFVVDNNSLYGAFNVAGANASSLDLIGRNITLIIKVR